MAMTIQGEEKLLLGRLLVEQQLISEEQLADAIVQQKQSGKRLGEILAGWNLLSQEHIQRALQKQRRLRLVATLATALFAPLEALAAAPVAPVDISVRSPAQEGAPQTLSDDELGAVSAAGLPEFIRHSEGSKSKGSGLDALHTLASIMNPVLNFLDADVTFKDVTYDPANASAMINADGSIRLSMPSSIGEISLEHIRVRGDRSGPSFGSISMRNIDLTGTTITLSLKK